MARNADGTEWSPEARSSYGPRQVAKITSEADIAIAGISASSGLLREFIALAKTNPLVGVLLTVLLTDILARGTNPVLSPAGKGLIYTLIGFSFGATIAVDLSQAADNIISALEGNPSGGSTNPGELIMPVATTLVENPPPPPPATRSGTNYNALIPAGAQ